MGSLRSHSLRWRLVPDHREAKNCTHKFDRATEDPSPRFFGNMKSYHSPLAAPSPRYTLPPSDRVIPALSPTVHVSITARTSSAAAHHVPIIDLTRQQSHPLKLMQQRGISHAPDPDPSRTKSWSLAHGPHHHAWPSPRAAYTDARTDLVAAALGHHADLVVGLERGAPRRMDAGNQDLETYRSMAITDARDAGHSERRPRDIVCRAGNCARRKAMEAMLAGGEPTGHRASQLPPFSHYLRYARRHHQHR
ncbi:hypothetical protein EDB83DRAFT_2518152 [Lactarius deliciosus]|nr:hypothetical protein EDB83DRAFT_2518152 [Lactarius deliciosus]